MDEDVFAVITETEGLWFKENEQQNTEPEVINTERNLMIRKKKATDRVDSDVQNHDSDMLTRINKMEKNMNELMKSVNDILQINTKIQTKLISVQEKLDSKIHHVIDQLNDKFEILENKLDKSVVNTSHGMHTLEQKVHNIESAASLLAISKIRPADLPYTMHCDSTIEGGAQSHMEACVQTRVAKLYDDFNDVLDFHVMLVNGAGPHEGRVEIVYRGQHGTICDTLWDYREATVVCKMLGYGRGGYPYRGSRFGNGTGKYFWRNWNARAKKVHC